MDRVVRNIPNAITMGNLLLGCLAVVLLFYDHIYIVDGIRGVRVDMARTPMACYLLFAAAGVDYLDGFVARALRAQSPIGGQLDSLADVVTFGLLPGLIMHQMLARAYYTGAGSFGVPNLLFAAGFLLTLCAAWRLARFNVEDSGRKGFRGVPTPTAALFVASLPLIALFDTTGIGRWLDRPAVLLGLTVVLAWGMMASFPLMSLKIEGPDWGKYRWEIAGLLSGWALFFLCIFALGLGWLTIPICILYYFGYSAVYVRFRDRPSTDPT